MKKGNIQMIGGNPRPMKIRFAAVALSLFLSLGACTSSMAQRYGREDSWHKVEFVRMVAEDVFDFPIAVDCRQESDNSRQEKQKSFALVMRGKRYGRWFYKPQYWIVPADIPLSVKAGDFLYANSEDCTKSVVPLDGTKR